MGGKETGCIVGPGSGLVGAVWFVFVRGVRWKQVCYSQVVHGLGVGLNESVASGPSKEVNWLH